MYLAGDFVEYEEFYKQESLFEMFEKTTSYYSSPNEMISKLSNLSEYYDKYRTINMAKKYKVMNMKTIDSTIPIMLYVGQ